MPASKRKRRYAATMESENIFINLNTRSQLLKKFDLKFEQIYVEKNFSEIKNSSERFQVPKITLWEDPV